MLPSELRSVLSAVPEDEEEEEEETVSRGDANERIEPARGVRGELDAEVDATGCSILARDVLRLSVCGVR
jgi:hypothetical protein